MFLLGEAPQRWTRDHHFLPRYSYRDPLGISTCCGPLHNGSDHFVTVYLCQEYWTILDPLYPTAASYPAYETQLHNALHESFTSRRLPPPNTIGSKESRYKTTPPYPRGHVAHSP